MGKQFNPEEKKNKVLLHVLIDRDLMENIEAVAEGYSVTVSTATREILRRFKDEWDAGSIPKTKEEEDKEVG